MRTMVLEAQVAERREHLLHLEPLQRADKRGSTRREERPDEGVDDDRGGVAPEEQDVVLRRGAGGSSIAGSDPNAMPKGSASAEHPAQVRPVVTGDGVERT